MLTTKSVPESVNVRYQSYKTASRDLCRMLAEAGEECKVPANENLLTYAIENNSYLFIADGFCRLTGSNKFIRLYSDSDFVLLNDSMAESWCLSSEFITHVLRFDRKKIAGALQSDSALAENWTRLLTIENEINLSLCAVYMGEDVQTDFQYREYNAGETIICEGDVSTEIFEMISGSAIVLRDGQEIGNINAGEPFGEISFLTESPRTATVKALEKCFVRTANHEEFQQLIQVNPRLIIAVSRTLAERVVHLNQRIVEMGAAHDGNKS